MGLNRKNLFSRLCILLFALYWVFSFYYYERIKKDPIIWDVVSYYGYLPATFIYKDLTLKFAENDRDYFVLKYWPETAPNGGKVIKTTMGVSYLYTPFFFLGHWYAGITGEQQTGYSIPYQVFLQIGTLFYILLGFVFLRKLLLLYFSDIITSLTIFSIFFGTNLLFYATGGALMAHAYIFSVSCLYLLAIDSWHKNPTYKTSAIIGLTGGLLTLIKPTLIICILIPALWGVTNMESLREKIKMFVRNKIHVVLIAICFIIPGIPQLIYWKYITGNWFFFSYTGERFFFDNPRIFSGWFSYRNGWLLYTPLMICALVGFFFMQKKIKQMKIAFLFFFCISAYLIHSWWCWWHGGYGLRAYVDLYGVLSFPLAAFYDFVFSRKNITRVITLSIISVLTAHNIFQEWQFEKGILHFAAMTKKSYWLGFLKTEVSGVWWGCLRDADIENAMKGQPEYINSDEENYNGYILKESNFEEVPPDKREFYSLKINRRGRYSFKLKDTNVPSPFIEFLGEDILKDKSSEQIIVSLQFYYSGNELKDSEGILTVSMESTSGVYYYKGLDFYTADSKPDQWNFISIKVPVSEIKGGKDKIAIYAWTSKPYREIYIDDLTVEISKRD